MILNVKKKCSKTHISETKGRKKKVDRIHKPEISRGKHSYSKRVDIEELR
jgi:hypothetical protein